MSSASLSSASTSLRTWSRTFLLSSLDSLQEHAERGHPRSGWWGLGWFRRGRLDASCRRRAERFLALPCHPARSSDRQIPGPRKRPECRRIWEITVGVAPDVIFSEHVLAHGKFLFLSKVVKHGRCGVSEWLRDCCSADVAKPIQWSFPCWMGYSSITT